MSDIIDRDSCVARSRVVVSVLDGDRVAARRCSLDIVKDNCAPGAAADVASGLVARALGARDDDRAVRELSVFTFEDEFLPTRAPCPGGHVGGPAVAPFEGDVGAGDGEGEPDVGTGGEVGLDPAVANVDGVVGAEG